MRGFGKSVFLGLIISLLSPLTGCQSTYYAAMEKFGKQKRDLLKDNIKDVRDEQTKAAETFKDALTRFREMYGSQGTDLEKTYDRLKSDYDRCVTRSDAVKSRIRKVEQISGDMFKEWSKEIAEMHSSSLQASSRDKLRITQDKYASLHSAMLKAENSMEPVLGQFKDQVLYLKHNLNAQAIGSLKGEASSVEQEVQQLIRDMNAAISEADSFIKTIPET